MRKGKTEKPRPRDELRAGYDLSKLKGRARAKYAKRYKTGTNLVLLSPDVAEHFPDDRSLNATLRKVIRAASKPSFSMKVRRS